MTRSALSVCLLLIVLAGCARVAHVAAPPEPAGSLVGPQWRLVRFEAPGAPAQLPGPDERYRVTFGAARVDGQVHCNGLAAGYTATDGRLAIGPPNVTATACVPPTMGDAVLAAFVASMAYAVRGDTLRLSVPDGRRLVFSSRPSQTSVAATAGAPAGSVWDDARRRGIVFRAVGREAPWTAEVFQDRRMRFARPGEEPAEFLRPIVNRVGGASVYTGEDDTRTVRLTLTDAPCPGPIDGDTFDVAVTVDDGGDSSEGCGRVVR